MDTTLLLYLDGEWQNVDLYEDIPITIVIQETDLTDLQGRKSPFSKQFTIPGTSNNANVFEHYYEVNGIDFNPLVKINAVVQYRGTDIFNGLCRLQSVIVTDTYVEYEVYIMGEVGDFISEIKDITLRDLDFTDLLHEQSYDNITLSWQSSGDTSGLFDGKIVYPLMNYGLIYPGTSTTPEFSFDFVSGTSFSNSGYAIPESYFKPAIRLYEIIQRIFSQTTYEVVSDFFETPYFKSIYMDLFQNGKTGIDTAEEASNQNFFKTYCLNKTKTYEGGGVLVPLFWRTSYPGGNDPLTNFQNVGNGVFRVPYTGTYSFNVRFIYESNGFSFQTNGDISVVVLRGTSPSSLGTVIYDGPNYEIGVRGFPPQEQSGTVNEFITLNLTAGQYISVFIRENDPFGGLEINDNYTIKAFSEGGVTDPFIMWDLYASPTLLGTQLVDVKLGIPELEAEAFIKSMIVMFNLVVVQDENTKTIRFEPYNSYYNEADRDEKDWTNKLDLTSSYKVEPLSFDLSKEIVYSYTKGSEEYLNKIFEDTYTYNYGRLRFVADYNILKGVQTYELPFAALPTQSLDGAPNFIIPQVYRELNGQQSPYSSKPHVFFWTGNRYSYTDATQQIQGSWYMFSGATAIQQTTYPCVSHLSSLDIYYPQYVSDLNFGTNIDFFFSGNPYPVQSTPYTLYNAFWNEYVSNTYSIETRRFTGKFYLFPLDLYETKLTDKIFVKDSFYRIERINDGNLISPDFTEVSLIKERGGYYQVDAPPPYYFLAPNEPYPTLTSLSAITAYTGTSQAVVCFSLSGTGTIYTPNPTPITNGDFVYNFDGSVYVPLPQGTFIKDTTDTITYVVINNIGQILNIDC